MSRENPMGISAALYSGSKCYFFAGDRYVRVTRGDVGAGTVDEGYPRNISKWGWPSGFGSDGIDAALFSGSKCYFFDGDRYIRVTRGDVGAGTVDAGYPKNLSVWGWPSGFGSREFILVHFKSLLPITTTIQDFMDTQYTELDRLFAGSGIDVRRGTAEDLSGDPNLSQLLALDVGACIRGQPTQEQNVLFANRNNAGRDDLVIYIVQTLQGGAGNFVGCATHPADQPGAAIVQTSARWLLVHEVGHVLGLRHVTTTPATNSDFLMWPNTSWTNTPPNISPGEASTMVASSLSRPF
jgi:Hemopexin